MASEPRRSYQTIGQYADSPLIIFRDVDELWCPEMTVIPVGYFLTGPSPGEGFPYANSRHPVHIKQSYALGRYPVTFQEYDHFCAEADWHRPSDEGWGRGRRPVINVTCRDAEAYCVWLSEITGFRYRLPGEAEWEYACRAGTTTAFSFGDQIAYNQANFASNLGKTSEVGTYEANAWGLHDMHGNVLEWTADLWDNNDCLTRSIGLSLIEAFHGARVCRGGSWVTISDVLKASARTYNGSNYSFNFLGFRVARML